jgi:hypothetical protein
MNRIHRLLVIKAVTLTLAAVLNSPAQAAAPYNDQFRMRAPMQIEQARVAGTGIVDRADGDAHLTLSRRCNQVASRGRLFGTLQQRVGDTFVAHSFLFRRATCETSSSDMRLTFRPDSDIAFGEGPATAWVRLKVCSEETRTCSRRRITREVLLAFP